MFLHLCVILFTGGGFSSRVLCPRELSVWGKGSPSEGSLSGGVCLGGLCRGDPPYGTEWVVRILLESILVSQALVD